ncbi:MAG: SIR2 family protein, partial [Anaerolineae bacterium]
QAGQPLNVVVSDTDLQFAAPGQPSLLKLFGDWQQPTSLIVTEQDQSALLNGRQPTKQGLLDMLRLLFKMQTVLFVGADLRDTAVTVLFDSVTGGQFQQPAFALWSGMNEREAQAWKSNRNLTVINADPLTFLQALLNN